MCGSLILFFMSSKFFLKALGHSDSRKIRVINTDKDKAYPKAIKDLKESGLLTNSLEHRAVKYLNNIIEQDHRYTKLRVITSLGSLVTPLAFTHSRQQVFLFFMGRTQGKVKNRFINSLPCAV